jgi:signal transduction histidine kinase
LIESSAGMWMLAAGASVLVNPLCKCAEIFIVAILGSPLHRMVVGLDGLMSGRQESSASSGGDMAGDAEETPITLLIGEIIAKFRGEILERCDNLIMDDTIISRAAAKHLHRQVVDVLDDLVRHLRPEAAAAGPIAGTATTGGHEPPLEDYLRASVALTEAVLGTVVARLPDRADALDGVVRLAVVLQRTVTGRPITAAVARLGYLMDQLHRSHADERRRVARELHDLVAHSVAVALQNLELYAINSTDEPDQAARRLDLALATLREALDTIRALAQDLRRSGSEDGLESALRATITDAVATGVAVELVFDGDEERVPPPIRGELFLILREALRNALAHAKAGRISIKVEIGGHAVLAVVRDNGLGFDPDAQAGGSGWASMRERAALLSGGIDVSSARGRGTTVRVQIPLRRSDENSP